MKKWTLLPLFLSFSVISFGSTNGKSTVYQEPIFYVLCILAVILLAYIFQLKSTLRNYIEHERNEEKKKRGGNPTLTLLAIIMAVPSISHAQGDAWSNFIENGFGSTDINALIFIIIIELCAVLYFHNILQSLTRKKIRLQDEAHVVSKVENNAQTSTFWDKFNQSVEIKDEASIMTDHDYDGIHELDNALPPWWKYGFYLTIVFSLVYMVHYHVTGTGPLMEQEYKNQIADAEKQIEEFRKNAKNLVDETSVTFLNNSEDIAAGKALFATNCITCHGDHAEGKIGPNLTDEYWKNGTGDIKDIFKTIKLGVSGTGMKSWKSDFSGLQIAQLSSYVTSLKGSNPANAKAPEGKLVSTTLSSDSLQKSEVVKDTLK
jgi:cytochrome c oxidase cbb3-type subunit 3